MSAGAKTSIRPGRRGDGEAMARVFVEAGLRAWTHFLPRAELAAASPSREHWERQLAGEHGAAGVVAERSGEVVAFAVVRPSQDPDADAGVGELDTLYGLPAVWGSGVARALQDEALRLIRDRGARQATLWTAEQNARARGFYESAGWRARRAAAPEELRRRRVHGAAVPDPARARLSQPVGCSVERAAFTRLRVGRPLPRG